MPGLSRRVSAGVSVASQPAPQPPPPQHTPIHNPSYAANPTMWHAVAMQQQRLVDMKLSLAPPRLPKPRRVPPPPPPPPPPGMHQCGECSGSDDEDDDDQHELQPTLTLAQRMGLAEAPEPELTCSEWEAIAEVSRERDLSKQGCVICCEDFKASRQVLLSCGHTFHKQCLRSWERHSKSRCCPVCRKLHYRKRAIDDGANLYRAECATRIESAWRGVLARRSTAKALRHANPQRLRRYCEQRLGGLTDALVGRLDAEHSAIDALFAEIDSSVAASRIVLNAGSVDWERTEEVARARGFGDCPVCLNSMAEGCGQPLALLSCTHVFHARCLDSFERFSLRPTCVCPVCRAAYARRQLGETGNEGEGPTGLCAAGADGVCSSGRRPTGHCCPPPGQPSSREPAAPSSGRAHDGATISAAGGSSAGGRSAGGRSAGGSSAGGSSAGGSSAGPRRRPAAHRGGSATAAAVTSAPAALAPRPAGESGLTRREARLVAGRAQGGQQQEAGREARPVAGRERRPQELLGAQHEREGRLAGGSREQRGQQQGAAATRASGRTEAAELLARIALGGTARSGGGASGQGGGHACGGDAGGAGGAGGLWPVASSQHQRATPVSSAGAAPSAGPARAAIRLLP